MNNNKITELKIALKDLDKKRKRIIKELNG